MTTNETQQYLTVPRQRLDTLSTALIESLGVLGEMLDSGLPPALHALEDASHALEAQPEVDGLSQIIALQIRLGERKMWTARESTVKVIALLRQAQKDLAHLTRNSVQSRSPKRGRSRIPTQTPGSAAAIQSQP